MKWSDVLDKASVCVSIYIQLHLKGRRVRESLRTGLKGIVIHEEQAKTRKRVDDPNKLRPLVDLVAADVQVLQEKEMRIAVPQLADHLTRQVRCPDRMTPLQLRNGVHAHQLIFVHPLGCLI